MGDDGQSSVLGVGLLAVVLIVCGLVWDGTRVLVARQRAGAVADAAALAGAGELDGAWIVDGQVTDPPRLDVAKAEGVARAAVGAAAEVEHRDYGVAELVAATDGVRVVVHIDVPMSFLVLAGLGAVDVSASAAAVAVQPGQGG